MVVVCSGHGGVFGTFSSDHSGAWNSAFSTELSSTADSAAHSAWVMVQEFLKEGSLGSEADLGGGEGEEEKGKKAQLSFGKVGSSVNTKAQRCYYGIGE